MAFITALLWGTGLSLGMCVGLVAWAWLRPWITGEKQRDDAAFTYNVAVLEALQERNRLTVELINEVERIADTARKAEVENLPTHCHDCNQPMDECDCEQRELPGGPDEDKTPWENGSLPS